MWDFRAGKERYQLGAVPGKEGHTNWIRSVGPYTTFCAVCYRTAQHGAVLRRVTQATEWGTFASSDCLVASTRWSMICYAVWCSSCCVPRTVRIVGDAVLTGSDDWTARVWTLNDGECEATIICHAAPVTCIEYVTASRGIITGEPTRR